MGGIHKAASEASVIEVDGLEAGKRKALTLDQHVMTRCLCQSISTTADLVGCSQHAVVSTYQKGYKEAQPENRRQSHGRQGVLICVGNKV